jgi:DNA-binding IclR family transcriptional regulator
MPATNAGFSSSQREPATLEVLDGEYVINVGWSDPARMGYDRRGRDSPLHASAPGKVLLSNRPEREVVRLSKIGFTPYT